MVFCWSCLANHSRLRISLGLKPLSDDSASDTKTKGGEGTVDAQPAKDKDEIAEDNYRARREAEAKEKDDEEIRAKITK